MVADGSEVGLEALLPSGIPMPLHSPVEVWPIRPPDRLRRPRLAIHHGR